MRTRPSGRRVAVPPPSRAFAGLPPRDQTPVAGFQISAPMVGSWPPPRTNTPTVVQQHRRGPVVLLLERAGQGRRFRCRIPDLRLQRIPPALLTRFKARHVWVGRDVAIGPADDQHPTVGQQHRAEASIARNEGAAGGTERPGRGIPQLDLSGTEKSRTDVDIATDDDDATVGEAGRRVAEAADGKRRSTRELLCRGIPELGRAEIAIRNRRTSGDQHATVVKERRGVLEARCRHVTNSPEPRFERRSDDRFGRRGVGSGHGRGLDAKHPAMAKRQPRSAAVGSAARSTCGRGSIHGERSAHPDRDQRRGQEQEAPSAWTPRTRDFAWNRVDCRPKGERRRRAVDDLGAVPGADSPFEFVLVHRADPLASAASILSWSCFRA